MTNLNEREKTMAWEWSHTDEAYANAYANLESQSKDWLNEVYAEWEAWGGEEKFNSLAYANALAHAKRLPLDALVDEIWEHMFEYLTCDNGGFDAWACPFGCHTVSFDKD